MLSLFSKNNCHSIDGYYDNLTVIDAARIRENNSKPKEKLIEKVIKVGMLEISTDKLSAEEISEALELSKEFQELDKGIKLLGISFEFSSYGQFSDVINEEAYKNLLNSREVTIEEARAAIQACRDLKTKLENKWNDIKFSMYSNSSIPQAKRMEVQNQLKEKKNPKQEEAPVFIFDEEEKLPSLQPGEAPNPTKQEDFERMLASIKSHFGPQELQDDETLVSDDIVKPSLTVEAVANGENQVQDADFEEVDKQETVGNQTEFKIESEAEPVANTWADIKMLPVDEKDQERKLYDVPEMPKQEVVKTELPEEKKEIPAQDDVIYTAEESEEQEATVDHTEFVRETKNTTKEDTYTKAAQKIIKAIGTKIKNVIKIVKEIFKTVVLLIEQYMKN